MIHYPIKFEAESISLGKEKVFRGQEKNFPAIVSSIPCELEGPGEGYSPEGLFALSIQSCMIAYFKYLCEKHHETYEKLTSKIIATLNRDTTLNQTLVTHVEIDIRISGSSDVEKCKKLLALAINNCPISNSIKAGKTLVLDVK
jgi:organic hydroperoxide reductase OsmC/OhrA